MLLSGPKCTQMPLLSKGILKFEFAIIGTVESLST